MVVRLIEGWESSTVLADYLGKWLTVPGAATISAGAGRFGNGLRVTSSTSNWSRTFDAQATWVTGFAVRILDISAGNAHLVALLDGAVVHCGLAIQASTNLLFAWRGTTGTVLGTPAATPLPVNTWVYVEAKFTISDTVGVVVVRVNGTPVISLTNQDTRNAGNATANTVRMGPAASFGTSLDFDDLYICDTTGSVNNDFLGDCKVEQVLPTGAGASTLWTPSAGSNWDAVNDSPAPDGDTTYVSSATAGQTDLYAFGDLGVASGTVKAVQATVLARKDDAGSRSLAVVARPGSTDRVGATQAVGDNYAGYTEVWNTNPDTAAAWTVAEVNASQFGVRMVA